MQTDQCALPGPQQYLSVQVSRGIPGRQQAHPVRPRNHGNLTSSLIVYITGIHQTVQVEAMGVFGWAVLVPGLPLGARPGEHDHAVLSVPVIAENSIGDQFQPGVVLNDVEVRNALLLRKPRDNVGLGSGQKFVAMLKFGVCPVVPANQAVEMRHLCRLEKAIQDDITIAIELFFQRRIVHGISRRGYQPLVLLRSTGVTWPHPQQQPPLPQKYERRLRVQQNRCRPSLMGSDGAPATLASTAFACWVTACAPYVLL